MTEFTLRTSIPTESEAKGVFYDGRLFFSSHTNLFRVKRISSIYLVQ